MSKESMPINDGVSIETKKLPAAEVSNEVFWVNQGIDIPFGFKKGESSKLGLFLIKDLDKATYHMEVMDNHFRSALVGRVLFKDREHDIAYLTDRTRRNQNLLQIYGTQFIRDKDNGKYVPASTEDPEHVDERRKEMGLDTLEENTKRINER